MQHMHAGMRCVHMPTRMRSHRQVSNIFVLLFVFMTMFALLGMQLFAGRCGSDESRWHFDYYFPAMLTILGIFSGGWVDPHAACSASESTLPPIVTWLYFVAALVIGCLAVLPPSALQSTRMR